RGPRGSACRSQPGRLRLLDPRPRATDGRSASTAAPPAADRLDCAKRPGSVVSAPGTDTKEKFMSMDTLLCACGCGKQRPRYVRGHGPKVGEKTLADRFWAKVLWSGEDECWIWTAPRDVKGYGRLAILRGE